MFKQHREPLRNRAVARLGGLIAVALGLAFALLLHSASAAPTTFSLTFEGTYRRSEPARRAPAEGRFTASAPFCSAGRAYDVRQVIDGEFLTAWRLHTCDDGSGSFTAFMPVARGEHDGRGSEDRRGHGKVYDVARHGRVHGNPRQRRPGQLRNDRVPDALAGARRLRCRPAGNRGASLRARRSFVSPSHMFTANRCHGAGSFDAHRLHGRGLGGACPGHNRRSEEDVQRARKSAHRSTNQPAGASPKRPNRAHNDRRPRQHERIIAVGQARLGAVRPARELGGRRGAAGQTAAPRVRLPQRREKVTLTVADVSCSPGTTGVEESAAALLASRVERLGRVAPASTIVVIEPSERPAAFASASALSLASATAFASACR